MKKIALTVRIDDEMYQKVRTLAENTDRSLSYVVEKSLLDFFQKNSHNQLELKLR